MLRVRAAIQVSVVRLSSRCPNGSGSVVGSRTWSLVHTEAYPRASARSAIAVTASRVPSGP
jgi:hypothetical protein